MHDPIPIGVGCNDPTSLPPCCSGDSGLQVSPLELPSWRWYTVQHIVYLRFMDGLPLLELGKKNRAMALFVRYSIHRLCTFHLHGRNTPFWFIQLVVKYGMNRRVTDKLPPKLVCLANFSDCPSSSKLCSVAESLVPSSSGQIS